MRLRKLNFLDKFLLWILRLNRRKIEKWINNKNILSKKDYEKIQKEWLVFGKKLKKFKFKKKYPNSSLKTLKKLEREIKFFRKKRDKGDISFNSFLEFKKFTIWFEVFYLETGFKKAFVNINHEKEHAKVYKKYNINYKFGWQKLFDNEKKTPYFVPFVGASAHKKIHVESLKVVANLSPGDKFDLKLMKK